VERNIEYHIAELTNRESNPGIATHGGYVELSKVSKHDER